MDSSAESPVRNDIELGPVTHWPTVYAAVGVAAAVLVGLAAVVALAAVQPAPPPDTPEAVAAVVPAPPPRPADAIVKTVPFVAASPTFGPPVWKPLVPHTPPPVVPDRPSLAPVVLATDEPAVSPPHPLRPSADARDFTEVALFDDLQRCAVPADLDAVAGTTKQLQRPVVDPIKTTAATGPSASEKKDSLAPAVGESVVKLIARRPDLAGLPTRGQSECTAPEDEAARMENLSRMVRRLLTRLPARATPNTSLNRAEDYDPGLRREETPIDARDIRVNELLDKQQVQKLFSEDTVSVWLQMLQADDPPVRVHLTKLLSAVKGRKAGDALARLALFDLSSEVRDAAVEALADRPAEDYRRTLLDGFRYPWAPVADHAAAALVTLNDRSAAEALAPMLDLPDPAAPTRNDEGKWVKAEVAKINHLRNCLLCHAPSSNSSDHVRGLVPRRDQPLPVEYYNRSAGEFVRADVTYLRQDFSVLETVARPGEWPAQQRFDYIVRRRPLTDQELIDMVYSDAPPRTYPQREAVKFALEKLTAPEGRPVDKVGLGP